MLLHFGHTSSSSLSSQPPGGAQPEKHIVTFDLFPAAAAGKAETKAKQKNKVALFTGNRLTGDPEAKKKALK